MNQEVNQQSKHMNKKNWITLSAIGVILGALIAGGIVYFSLNNSYLESRAQFLNKISMLQQQIKGLEKESEPMELLTPEDEQKSKQDEDSYFIPSFDIDNPDITSCSFWKDRIYGQVDSHESMAEVNDGAGTLFVEGKIVQRIEDASWEDNKKVTKVYLVFSDPVNDAQRFFYSYYSLLATKGNGINRIDGQQLFFRLGFKEGSELISSSVISEELKSQIISLIDQDKDIKIQLTIPIYHGGGVGDEFSFACEIAEK